MQGSYEIKTKKGVIKVIVNIEKNKIEWIRIEGDFFIYPEDVVWKAENELKGLEVNEDLIKNKIREIFKNVEFVGSSIEDFENVIINAIREAGK